MGRIIQERRWRTNSETKSQTQPPRNQHVTFKLFSVLSIGRRSSRVSILCRLGVRLLNVFRSFAVEKGKLFVYWTYAFFRGCVRSQTCINPLSTFPHFSPLVPFIFLSTFCCAVRITFCVCLFSILIVYRKCKGRFLNDYGRNCTNSLNNRKSMLLPVFGTYWVGLCCWCSIS